MNGNGVMGVQTAPPASIKKADRLLEIIRSKTGEVPSEFVPSFTEEEKNNFEDQFLEDNFDFDEYGDDDENNEGEEVFDEQD